MHTDKFMIHLLKYLPATGEKNLECKVFGLQQFYCTSYALVCPFHFIRHF